MTDYDWVRLHAIFNDLPIALLVTAVFFDLIGVIGRRPALRQVGFYALIVGTVGGAAAVISGLQAEGAIPHGGAVHEVMEEHEQLAFITLAVFGVLALWRIFRESRMGSGERIATLVVSLFGIGVLVSTGDHGGELVFDHAAGIRSEVLQAELGERSKGHEHAPGEEHPHHGEAATPMPADTAADTTSAAGHQHPAGTPAHTH